MINSSIKLKLTILFSIVIIPVILGMSLLYYRQVKSALNERVLLQLWSIQSLKQAQIEDYISEKVEYLKLVDSSINEEVHLTDYIRTDDSLYITTSGNFPGNQKKLNLQPGRVTILDITGKKSSSTRVALVLGRENSEYLVLESELEELESILLLRTGMGETGETYLVGSDFTMRSVSRFFPDKPPSEITVKTVGTEQGINGRNGRGIFPDYRGIPVFSAYNPIQILDLDWVILTEIDEAEALEPVRSLRFNIFLISLFALLLVIFIIFSTVSSIVRPINRMKSILQEMSLGKIGELDRPLRSKGDEIDEMYNALNQLIASSKNVIAFADQVGVQEFDVEYQPLSDEDVLGKSLVQMRDKLKEYREKEENYLLESQKALLRGQDNERARISKELHDGLGPLLTSLRLMIQTTSMETQKSQEIKQLIDDIIVEVRRISNNLMPQALIDFGVGEALANLAERFRKVSKIEVNYINALNAKSKLPPEVNIGLYRIAQEAMNNGIKHAKANTISVSLTEFDDTINFFYKDDGVGFDLSQPNTGSGLLNMKERCRLLNGEFFMESSKQNGTTIEIVIKKMNYD